MAIANMNGKQAERQVQKYFHDHGVKVVKPANSKKLPKMCSEYKSEKCEICNKNCNCNVWIITHQKFKDHTGADKKMDLMYYNCTTRDIVSIEIRSQITSGSVDEKYENIVRNIEARSYPGQFMFIIFGDGMRQSKLKWVIEKSEALDFYVIRTLDQLGIHPEGLTVDRNHPLLKIDITAPKKSNAGRKRKTDVSPPMKLLISLSNILSEKLKSRASFQAHISRILDHECEVKIPEISQKLMNKVYDETENKTRAVAILKIATSHANACKRRHVVEQDIDYANLICKLVDESS